MPWGWADALQPYIKSTQVFQCPSQTAVKGSINPIVGGYTDYWFNDWLDIPVAGPGGSTSGILESQVTYPANTVIFGDGYGLRARSNTTGVGLGKSTTLAYNNDVQSIGYFGGGGWNLPATIGSAGDFTAQRHNGGANYAFIDGHVKWLPGTTPAQCMQITAGSAATIGPTVFSFRAY